MGLMQSHLCVSLDMLPPEVWAELQAETFTVQRNSKEEDGPKAGEPACTEEDGWIVCGDVIRWPTTSSIFTIRSFVKRLF
jgi:hypothetical protein